MTWCAGTCVGGGQKVVSLGLNYLDTRLTGPSMLEKAEWFAIPSAGGGIVYPLGVQRTSTSVNEGTGRRITYTLDLDLSKYCGPSGSALVFAVAYSADQKWVAKEGNFRSVNFLPPVRYSNDCLKWNY